jgi:hypothetical protein
MTNSLAVEEESFPGTQQSVCPRQVSQVAGTVKELGRGNSRRNLQWDLTVRDGYFSRCACAHSALRLLVMYENDLHCDSQIGRLKSLRAVLKTLKSRSPLKKTDNQSIRNNIF